MTETYKLVRSLKRGLDVLEALNNEEPNTPIARISEKTGIHRTTVYRLLETLESLGYVRKGVGDDCYRLTHKVRYLSNGIDERTEFADAAAPRLRSLLDEIVWPSSIAGRGDDAMIIWETTHGASRVFVHNITVGARSPFLTSAMGRAYLAFCDESEREAILRRLATSNAPGGRLARDPAYIKSLIGTTRDQGFGLSFGDTESRLGSIALPVRRQGHAIGCINVVFLTSAISRDSAISAYLPPLQRAAGAIERDLLLN